MTTPTTVNIRLQLRADTAANWTAANPTLLANEVGLETDTKKLKVGDGSTAWASLAYFPSIVSGGTVLGNLEIGSTGTLTFEGSTADGFETTLTVTDPTADRTITLPNQSGTVVVSGNASIVDADIAANAEIAVSKLANGTANQVLVTDGTDVSWSDDLTLAGNLTVNGTTTTINTQDLLVEDKNIIIGNVDTPSDVTADGGGVTLKGATDKTINWIDATDSWTSSENIDLANGKSYRINDTEVLSATTLGSGVTSSSLTSVGTITSGTWQGSAIGASYLDSTVVTTGDTGTITSTMIADGTIVNADVSASAAIAHSKLANITAGYALIGNATNVPTATEVTGDVTISDTGVTAISSGVIVNADVSASAAIAGSKVSPDFGSQTITTTGVISAAAGTAAAPSITFTGDLNTGIYSPGADQLALSTSGAEALRINADGDIQVADGNRMEIDEIRARDAAGLKLFDDAGAGIFIQDGGSVGIGTSSPGSLLSVKTTGGSDLFYVDDNTSKFYFSPNGSGEGIIKLDTANAIRFLNAGGERLRISSGGNVGIGTTSAGSPLHVKANSSEGIRIESPDFAGIYGLLTSRRSSGSPLDIAAVHSVGALEPEISFSRSTNGSTFSESARFDKSGRLLVGTSSDSGGALLQVNGDRVRIATAKTPASASATGTAGEVCWDTNYIYVCTATNTWKRAALSTW